MPVSKRSQTRRCKRKFTRFKFQLRNGNKSKSYHQGLADGKAGYGARYSYMSIIHYDVTSYKHLTDYIEGYSKGKEYLL